MTRAFVLSQHPLLSGLKNVAQPRVVGFLILPPFCCLVSMALLYLSRGSRSGLTSQNGYHGNTDKGLSVAMATADARRRNLGLVTVATP